MTIRRIAAACLLTCATVLGLMTVAARAEEQWITYPGGEGPGKGKSIVFMAGDEEYRSEEALPMLAKLLAKHHGFKCTVVFSIDPKTGEISPNTADNTPGIEALDSADLLVILTRFRKLPDDQMKHVDDYLKAGKPVIGLRTATHAFAGMKGTYEKYNNGYKGKEAGWEGGFGRFVLGEKWVSHWGSHRNESTRGIFAPGAAGNPLLNGIKDGEIWGSTDVYEAHPPADAKVLVLGQVCKRTGPSLKDDPDYGMRPEDTVLPAEEDKKKKNDPMMPVVWTKAYQLPDGKPGKAFTTTMGASTDLANEALRRLLVNAAYDLVGLPVPEKADVTIVGEYKPNAYRPNNYVKGVKPSDLK